MGVPDWHSIPQPPPPKIALRRYTPGMIRRLALLLLLLAACAPAPPALPTLAVLPSAAPPSSTLLPPSSTHTPLPPSSTPMPTSTPLPPTGTPLPATRPTRTPAQPTQAAPTLTITPSLTITSTITPTPSSTPTATLDLGPLAALAQAAANATVLPLEQRYPAPTLTALAQAAASLRQATLSAFATLPPPGVTSGPGVVLVTPQGTSLPLATLPPAPTGPCPVSPPGGLGGMLAQDPALAASIGCPSGAFTTLAAAWQPFERGAMLYLQGTPGAIYVLTSDGRFRRFDDTWQAGVNPESGGLVPPPGLVEPIRGFGKVWRLNPDVQAMLGWGTSSERGDTATLQPFERGRAVALSAQAQTVLLADDAQFTGGGVWRSFAGSF